MLKKIEALRTQPKHIRNRYAFWIALGVTLFITVIWGMNVPERFVDEAVLETARKDSGSSFIHTLGKITSEFKEALGNLKGTVEYKQDTEVVDVKPVQTLDLNALVASSSKKKMNATTTNATSSVELKAPKTQ